ncbi:BgtA-21035 [Blumeria graminis f. sp. tritici]|uniref:BgtA-21035 n=2 Tax=Blumeria graminis f. sp. tritici TaxID=62690 RepID=A0A9X9L6U1_BLUGR|nr:hypothetical protein BGT96224_A21035 [Blumeria graminis f. sp. tritici 96224]VCU38775.1 BgtA-21035 [Blumeria graminis f. sp. tritici]
MNHDQLPSSIEEVETLIKRLYGVGKPEDIVRTQIVLHKLQLSSQGWQLANALLNRDDNQLRFFAALTIIVKLNTDAKSLSENDTASLLLALINSLILWTKSDEGPLVGRKLCSALVSYFLQFSHIWSRCVQHLLYCFCRDEALPYTSLREAPDSIILVQNVSDKKARAVLWFASTLVEDVSKTDSNSMRTHKFHSHIRPNVNDVVPLIRKYLFEAPNQALTRTQQEAMKCFQSCMSYSHRSFIDKEAELDVLHNLTQPALQHIVNDELYETTVELFIDILSTYSRFLQPEDFDNLLSLFSTPWALKRYQTLVEGNYDWESLQFGMLLLAFGDAIVKELTQKIEVPRYNQYLVLLLGLLEAKGYAVAEDKIYVPALEFWSTFVECMVDESFSVESGTTPPWFPMAKSFVMQAIQSCWYKSHYPNAKIFSSWDSVDIAGFKDARRDLSDLNQQFYLVAGCSMLNFWVEKVSHSAANKNWLELEASFFCLEQLNDSISEPSHRDNVMDQVFTPDLIALFTQQHLEIFSITRRTFLNLVGGYANYFKTRSLLLLQVLNIAFVALKSSGLADQASRCILKLCSDCRSNLVPDLDGFIQHYSSIALDNTLDHNIKESVIEGITCLIQALDDDESKIGPLNQLLNYVEADVSNCLHILGNQRPTSEDMKPLCSPTEEAKAIDIGILSLKCLLGIARGIQAPDDQPINLDKGDGYVSVWTIETGLLVQKRIYNIIEQVYEALGSHGEIIEQCCLVWRQGLRELEPGPFVLPSSLVSQFMMKTNLQTPRLGLVIKTAASFTSAKHNSNPEEVLGPLLAWVAYLLHDLGGPASDTEIAHAGIEFMYRLLPKYLGVLMSHRPSTSLEYLFMFALEAMKGNDPLPKSAAADFWGAFFSVTSPPIDIQSDLTSAIQVLGPLLARALIFNIGGSAARSELEKVSDPIKKIVTCHVNAKRWLEEALVDSNFPSDRVNNKDKSIFLQKLMNLRGSQTTTQVVKDFWLACRGSQFAYAS